MKFIRFLSIRNIVRRPVRSVALGLISAFLALSVFDGSLIVQSLQNGLKSYEERLGADIVVVPYEARTKGTFESVLLQGIPGNFYMDDQYYQKICGIEGVETAAPEFFLASSSAGCCSVPVQVIGFDPDKDFTIRPWIRESYAGELGTGDIIVGNHLNVPPDHMLKFYNVNCRVVAQLAETGTGLDTAVYTNMDTIGQMVSNAKELGFHYFDDIRPGRTVSSVMVKVAEGYDPEEVTGDINIHVRHVVASRSGSMFSDIAGGLRNVARMIGLLTAVIWILAVVILSVAFALIMHERAKEFAVLLITGASGRMVSAALLMESGLISFVGALAGIALGALLVFPFSNLIGTVLELPFLMPGAGRILMLAAGALLLSVVCSALVSAVAVSRISRRDTSLLLRQEG